MIPYFEQPRLWFIHAFGALVATGILVGMHLVRRRAQATGLDPAFADRLAMWIVVGGFVGAHLVDRLVYFPGETLARPVTLLRFWEGLSSFGGFLGATVTALVYRRRSLPRAERRRYLDLLAYALPVGWVIGRTGCFVAFDHPGVETTFFLGQRSADGVIRHNLGLEEALLTLPLALLFLWLGRGGRERRPGLFVGLAALLYAPVRFLLDFLRASDVRYAGLTPGQYGAVALLILGAVILARAPALTPAAPRA